VPSELLSGCSIKLALDFHSFLVSLVAFSFPLILIWSGDQKIERQ